MRFRYSLLSVALLLLTSSSAWAIDPQIKASENTPNEPETVADGTSDQRFQQFEETLTGAKFTGKFTVVGKPEKGVREETYEIKSVQKLEEGDFWLFKARVKYGDHDIVVPMPLEVKWAGDTPIITLTNTTIPGLGTFSSRVVIHNDWYAGTWIHGEVGGHLFGTISREEAKQEPK